MKQIKKTNRGWRLLSILPLAGLLMAGMGFVVPAFAGPGVQISPKVLQPHFNVPSARPAIPCSNLVFQGVRMIGTDFFNPGRNANHYSIHLMTSVLNSGNATYNPKPTGKVIVSGRDMGPRSSFSRTIPRLSVNQRARVDITAVIQGHLAPRSPLSVWLDSSVNECSHRNNTFIVRPGQLRAGFLAARRRAEAARRPVIVHVHPASSSGTARGSRVCANLSPVSFSIRSKSLVPGAALGTGHRVDAYRLSLRGVVENSRDTYRGTFGRVVLKRSSGSSHTTIRTQLVNNLNHGQRTTIDFITSPISIVEPNMPQYTLSVENTQRGDTACNALHAQHHPDLTISRGTVRAALR